MGIESRINKLEDELRPKKAVFLPFNVYNISGMPEEAGEIYERLREIEKDADLKKDMNVGYNIINLESTKFEGRGAERYFESVERRLETLRELFGDKIEEYRLKEIENDIKGLHRKVESGFFKRG